jgi:hypothetical protein
MAGSGVGRTPRRRESSCEVPYEAVVVRPAGAGDVGRAAAQRWDENLATYVGELESLRGRLAPDVFASFRDADVHDGSLVNLLIRDFNPLAARPVDSTDDDQDGNDLGLWEGPYRVTVDMRVATSDEARDTDWTLRYAHIRPILVDLPTDTPLFFDPGDGFEDWGYHELSDAGDGFLRHEVLFASGSTVLVEFRDVSVERVDRPSLPAAT